MWNRARVTARLVLRIDIFPYSFEAQGVPDPNGRCIASYMGFLRLPLLSETASVSVHHGQQNQ